MAMIPTSVPVRPICDWKEDITIIPYSGIQILDFGFALDELTALRPARFVERAGKVEGNLEERTLIPYSGNQERDERIEAEQRDDDD